MAVKPKKRRTHSLQVGEAYYGGDTGPISAAQKPAWGQNFDSRTAGELVDDRQLVARIHKWYFQSSEESQEWRARHIENLRFASGDQWRDEDKDKLTREKRPILTINKSSTILFSISGLQRKARQDIDILPEDPEDTISAEIMEKLVKWVRDQNGMKQVSADVFMNKALSGLGFWKLYYDFVERPQGAIKLRSINPLNIFWDPNYPDLPWNECEYVIHAEFLNMEQAIEDWPEQEGRIRAKFGDWLSALNSGTPQTAGDSKYDRRAFWDPQTQRVRMLQVFYKALERVRMAVFANGDIEDDPDKVDAIEQALTSVSESSTTILTRPVMKVRMAHVFADLLFDDKPSPYPFNEFPIFPAKGYYFWKHPFGLMDMMKDPQREKNKRRTQIVEIAGRTAHSGFMYQEGTVDPEILEEVANGAGANIPYRDKEPTAIKPPQLPQVLVDLEAKADREIQQVVNYNDELAGQTTQKTVSGAAIEARQQGGLVSQEMLFDTFQDEESEMTKYLIEMIKDNITEEEALRIVGSLVRKEGAQGGGAMGMGMMGGPMPPAMGQGMPGMPPLQPQLADLAADPSVLREVLSKAFNTKYKVVVTTKPYAASHSVWKMNALLKTAQLIPGILPPNLIVEAMADAGLLDHANAQKALAHITQNPPQIQLQQQTRQQGLEPPDMGNPISGL